MNFCLDIFLSFATTKCIRVISYSRMFISRRLLPGVAEVLWYLAVDQLCNPSEMFCILHWNTLERSGCTLKSSFLCVWIINSVLFQTSIQINYEKKWAVGQDVFSNILWMSSVLMRKFLWHIIYLIDIWMWNHCFYTTPQMVSLISYLKVFH